MQRAGPLEPDWELVGFGVIVTMYIGVKIYRLKALVLKRIFQNEIKAHELMDQRENRQLESQVLVRCLFDVEEVEDGHA